ncbi:hypothetical protein CHS0354_029036 [Potamilus streckersoni]|uniref:Uncharacterized protein n=1 Tax=Potamilus streckersoni TaxID=2493646 RepID=A0AAE0VVY4_9BIVA|nr:hypothetical protein CHS0354_029036 [Potamilus streckersoni]
MDIPCDCLLDTSTPIIANRKFVIDCSSRNLTYIPDVHIPEGNNTIVKLSHPFLKRRILVEMIDISNNPFEKEELVPGLFGSTYRPQLEKTHLSTVWTQITRAAGSFR